MVAHASADQLAETGAEERGQEQLHGEAPPVARGGGEQEREPAVDRGPAKQTDRVPDRLDPASADRCRVHDPEQLVRQRDVDAELLLKHGIRDVGVAHEVHQLEDLHLHGRQILARDRLRPLEDVALEQVEADRLAELEHLPRLDLLCEQVRVGRADAVDQPRDLLGRPVEHVDLYDFGDLEERRPPLVQDEVVQRETVPAPGQVTACPDHRLVRIDRLQDLHHHQLRVEELDRPREQQVSSAVDVRRAPVREVLEADPNERIYDHTSRHVDRDVRGCAVAVQAVAVEEFVADDAILSVEYRLPRDKHIHWQVSPRRGTRL